MVSGSLPELLSAGLLLLAAGYCYVLSTSKAEDPKFRLLNSLLRSADNETTHSHHRHAA